MDPALLITDSFWKDAAPCAWSSIPDLPQLSSHVLFETSGSSGKPKWIAIHKKALLASAQAVNQHLRVDATSIWGLALPIHHVGGFGVAARAYQAGCGFNVFPDRWNPHAFAAWLGENRVTHTSLVPAQVHDLVSHHISCPDTLKAVVVGGGHLDVKSGASARSLGWPVLASYGMTEASSQIATQRLELLDQPYHPAPIDILPLWETRTDEAGRLSIRGPALFSGTIENGAYIPRPHEWHETSDQVLLENNTLSPQGRLDTRVKILGELVDPEAIEQEIADLSESENGPVCFLIIPSPDARSENKLICVCETQDAADHLIPLLAAYNHTAPGFRRLPHPAVIGTFPRSELGKIRRKAVAQIYQQSDILDQ